MTSTLTAKAIHEIFDSLRTGILVFEGNKLLSASPSAKELLQLPPGFSASNLGPYQDSLLALLALSEDGYSKQLTGVVGKPVSAHLHLQGNLKVVELSESMETRLGEASHELRRPLSNIKTLVDTLYLWGAGEDPEARRRFLGQLHAQVERMTNMVNDLLSLSRMQAGSIPLNFQQIALKVMVQECFDMLREQAQEKQVELISEVPDDYVLIADLDKISHVVQNLIENAIRYNKTGGRVVVQGEPQSNVFSVSDTGQGIPPESAELVFERFKRLNKDIPGTGLGLAIVKTIVDLHGGTITLNSKVGEGSKFTVNLPPRKIVLPPS